MPGTRGFALWRFLFIAFLGAFFGCSSSAPEGPELLSVIDVAPREVDVGDRIEVLGTNLPTGEVKEAKVVFTGDLRRPGQAPLENQEITVDKAQISSDKVSMIFTEGLQTLFCGHGDEAAHTTFYGDVTVKLPTAQGGLPVKG